MLRYTSASSMKPSRLVRNQSTLQAATHIHTPTPSWKKFYDIKKQVDEYAYYLSLSKKERVLAYRRKHESELTDLSKVNPVVSNYNKMNSGLKNPNKDVPLVSRTFPGIPSTYKFATFIDKLRTKEELLDLLPTLKLIDQSYAKEIALFKPFKGANSKLAKKLITPPQFKLSGEVLNSTFVRAFDLLKGQDLSKTLSYIYGLKEFQKELPYDTLNVQLLLKLLRSKMQNTPSIDSTANLIKLQYPLANSHMSKLSNVVNNRPEKVSNELKYFHDKQTVDRSFTKLLELTLFLNHFKILQSRSQQGTLHAKDSHLKMSVPSFNNSIISEFSYLNALGVSSDSSVGTKQDRFEFIENPIFANLISDSSNKAQREYRSWKINHAILKEFKSIYGELDSIPELSQVFKLSPELLQSLDTLEAKLDSLLAESNEVNYLDFLYSKVEEFTPPTKAEAEVEAGAESEEAKA